MKKTKKKQKVKKSFIKGFLFFIVLCFGVFSFISIANVWSEIYSKNKEHKELEKDLTKLEKEEEKLKIDVEKMQDPEYVARYLREKFYYSKSGEYIIRMPD